MENNDVHKRNLLYFFDDAGANLIESMVESNKKDANNFIPDIVKVIGSNETETLNEGTISSFEFAGNRFYTLILRDIEERLKNEDQISFLTKQTQYLEDLPHRLPHPLGQTLQYLESELLS